MKNWTKYATDCANVYSSNPWGFGKYLQEGAKPPLSLPIDSYLLAESRFLPPWNIQQICQTLTWHCLFPAQPCFSCFYFLIPLALHALGDVYCRQSYFSLWPVQFVSLPSVSWQVTGHPANCIPFYPAAESCSQPLSNTHSESYYSDFFFLKLLKGSSKSSEVVVLLRSDILFCLQGFMSTLYRKINPSTYWGRSSFVLVGKLLLLMKLYSTCVLLWKRPRWIFGAWFSILFICF